MHGGVCGCDEGDDVDDDVIAYYPQCTPSLKRGTHSHAHTHDRRHKSAPHNCGLAPGDFDTRRRDRLRVWRDYAGVLISELRAHICLQCARVCAQSLQRARARTQNCPCFCARRCVQRIMLSLATTTATLRRCKRCTLAAEI